MQDIAQFNKTKIILSLWYSFILLIILVAFSIALSITYNNDVERIVLRQDFGNHVPAKLSHIEERLIIAQVHELRSSSLINLIIIDGITLIIGAGLSYFLALKTLNPIQKNIESQRLFIADASHELRNPVSTIQSACEVVLRKSNRTKEDYKSVIEQVLDQSQRLGKLVNDLLSLSVLNASNTSHSFSDLSLSKIAEEELNAMEAVFTQSQLQLDRFITPNVSISGDQDKIRELLGILLDNAIKFTPEGGKISVSISDSPQPKLIVEDSGIGIEPAKQKAIFRRFYQADESRSGKGAGLGLAIADSIMRLHKGEIYVKSVFGKGSKFVCIFPWHIA